jgi:hypothetical protein
MNLDRLRAIEEERCQRTSEIPLEIDEQEILEFAHTQYNKGRGTEASPWNGRQIRNAFQVAASLAHFDARAANAETNQLALSSRAKLKLGANYFQMIQRTTTDFEEYMREVVQHTDSQTAFQRADRADHWVPPTPAATVWSISQGAEYEG